MVKHVLESCGIMALHSVQYTTENPSCKTLCAFVIFCHLYAAACIRLPP